MDKEKLNTESNLIGSDLNNYKNVYIGNGNFIEKGVKIYENVYIGNNNKIYDGTIIYPNTKIGNNNVILNNNVLGEYGVEAKYEFKGKEFKGLEIGNNNYFHVNNLIFGGFHKKTLIGNNNKFLSEVSIHHDTEIGNHVVLYPRSITAGLTKLMDYSVMGMQSCIQQNSVLGPFSMIGMGSVASHNVFPFYIYYNQVYQRFNKVKIPEELHIDNYKEGIDNLIKELKFGDFDKEIIMKYNLPENINYYIIEFINSLKNNKI